MHSQPPSAIPRWNNSLKKLPPFGQGDTEKSVHCNVPEFDKSYLSVTCVTGAAWGRAPSLAVLKPRTNLNVFMRKLGVYKRVNPYTVMLWFTFSEGIRATQHNVILKIKGGFPGVTVVKKPPANAGDTGSSPVWEDPTCRGATKPVRHNYWARMPRAPALQQEKPLQSRVP